MLDEYSKLEVSSPVLPRVLSCASYSQNRFVGHLMIPISFTKAAKEVPRKTYLGLVSPSAGCSCKFQYMESGIVFV